MPETEGCVDEFGDRVDGVVGVMVDGDGGYGVGEKDGNAAGDIDGNGVGYGLVGSDSKTQPQTWYCS